MHIDMKNDVFSLYILCKSESSKHVVNFAKNITNPFYSEYYDYEFKTSKIQNKMFQFKL